MTDFKELTRVKELPRVSDNYNYKREHLKFLKMQLDFIYKKTRQGDNIFRYETELDAIYNIYRKLKQDCIVLK